MATGFLFSSLLIMEILSSERQLRDKNLPIAALAARVGFILTGGIDVVLPFIGNTTEQCTNESLRLQKDEDIETPREEIEKLNDWRRLVINKTLIIDEAHKENLVLHKMLEDKNEKMNNYNNTFTKMLEEKQLLMDQIKDKDETISELNKILQNQTSCLEESNMTAAREEIQNLKNELKNQSLTNQELNQRHDAVLEWNKNLGRISANKTQIIDETRKEYQNIKKVLDDKNEEINSSNKTLTKILEEKQSLINQMKQTSCLEDKELFKFKDGDIRMVVPQWICFIIAGCTGLLLIIIIILLIWFLRKNKVKYQENISIKQSIVDPNLNVEGKKITNDTLINADIFDEWKSVNVTKKKDSNEDLFDMHETKGEYDNTDITTE